jgi:hypothetical protein
VPKVGSAGRIIGLQRRITGGELGDGVRLSGERLTRHDALFEAASRRGEARARRGTTALAACRGEHGDLLEASEIG